MIEPLWPPKPRLFDIAGPGVQGRAAPITRSISMPSSSTVVPAVGGISAVLHRQQQGGGLESPCGAEGMAGDALGGGHRHSTGAEDRGDCCGFCRVVERGAGAVGVELLDVAGRQAGVAESRVHAHDGAGAAGGGSGDVVGVGVAGSAEHLTEDGGATIDSGLPFLEHQHGCAFAEHEAVALGGEGAAVAGRAEGGHVAERCLADAATGALAATGDTGIDHAPCHQTGGVADGVGGRRARGDDGLVRPLQAVAHRDGRTCGVGHHHRHEERRHPALTLFEEHLDLVLGGAQAADAGAEDDTEAAGLGRGPTGLDRSTRRRRRGRTARSGRPGALPWGWRSRAGGPSRRSPRCGRW